MCLLALAGGAYHEAMPILAGERSNLILWVFGQHGSVRVAPYADGESGRTNASSRWGQGKLGDDDEVWSKAVSEDQPYRSTSIENLDIEKRGRDDNLKVHDEL